MNVYKIRRKSDGLFSEGGAGGPRVRFSKIGKSWHHLRHAVAHLKISRLRSEYFNMTNPYLGTCEIVEFELVERAVIESIQRNPIAPKKRRPV